VLSTGVMIDSPAIGRFALTSGRGWYFALLAFAALALLVSVNLQRSRTGRAWRALRERDVVAGALGINVQRFKLLAFMISATMTTIAGALFAYFRNFVSIDAFSLYLTVQYVAMIIIGGMGSIPGALLGAAFVILFPYAIEAIAGYLPARFSNMVFALDYAAFGVVMILFLLLEPAGLMGIWQRMRNAIAAWRLSKREWRAPQ
jgi:branched-chain amino acid transport system permease protein